MFDSVNRAGVAEAMALAFAASAALLSHPSSVFAALGGSGNPRELTRSGMAKFMKGDVGGSISDFDAVLDVAPGQSPYLWQRGKSFG